jgi:hypothetical protein
LRKGRALRRRTYALAFSGKVKQRTLSSPLRFSLADPEWRDKSSKFLSRLREPDEIEFDTTLDFSATVLFEVSATLVLRSIVDGIISRYPRVVIRCVLPRTHREREVLSHIGLLKDLGRKGVLPSALDVVSWSMSKGTNVDGERAGLVIEEVLPRQFHSVAFRAVSEGIANAVEHSGKNEFFSTSNWWMFARQAGTKFIVAVCDLGVGIPGTLQSKYPTEYILSIYSLIGDSGHRDAKLIEAATKLRRTSTNESHRGRGLGNMVDLVRSLPGSELYIFSNRGVFHAQHRKGKVGYYRYRLQESLKGTLIVWTINCGEVDSNWMSEDDS